ncbi:unnamed protein product [Phytophthora lilii]|uniref:Unnamed protein product n=1 Tax=Phytophthora lilii TaxID=2077276 RepID=A0A9W6THF7_9STRA|nr:unnamed protein product [Phytophthora lilii]
MMRGRGQVPDNLKETPDPLAGEPTDEYGIPLSVAHSPQTDLPVWQFIHQLASPFPNTKSPERPYTHVCVLCSASPPFRPTSRKQPTWRCALMRQRMSTNAVSHLQRMHPEKFEAIEDYKQRRREELKRKAAAAAAEEGGDDQPKKKRAKTTPGPKKNKTNNQKEDQQSKEGDAVTAGEANDVELVTNQNSSVSARKRAVGKTVDLVKKWLISSGLPVSMLQDEAFQRLWKLSNSTVLALPTTLDFNAHVQDEFVKFSSFLESYLTAELQAAMGLPFLSLRHEFQPITSVVTENGVSDDEVSKQQQTFFSITAGFIDSHWRRVDLVLSAKLVPRGWDQQINQIVTQTVSETYGIPAISNYARFRFDTEGDTLVAHAVGGDYESIADGQEDLLTNTLRGCVVDALGVGASCSFSNENDVRRILRLLQGLAKHFEAPDRISALLEIGATHGLHVPYFSAPSIDKLALSTSSSIGAIAELLRVSCTRYSAYSIYFQCSERPTAAGPESEAAWTQLSLDDWRTATELEAMLNQLTQFRLEERLAPRPGPIAQSYALLFRRLLAVTTKASHLKLILLEDDSNSFSAKRAARRKLYRVDTFTLAGQQCFLRLRQLITQRFRAPSTLSAVDDEIKAMLLDPRISYKAANLVTDTQAYRRAQEALREEHRVVFELLAARQSSTGLNTEPEDEDEDVDDDEMSALLMVDGPKNQPPAAPSTTSSGRHSSDAVAEDEARAWREWQQVYVAWDTLATEGADLFDKGQYNLLKLYHHVDILKWFREVGQQAHPAASLLARIYLGKQSLPSRALKASFERFMKQDEADWLLGSARQVENRCILHHNWCQYQKLSAEVVIPHVNNENGSTSLI